MPKMSLQLGSSAPDFSLPTPHGVEVTLGSCLLAGSVLVEFLRGTWDPDSRKRIDALGRGRDGLRAAGTRVLLVACERPETAAAYLAEHPTPWTFLVDTDRKVARGYGVLRRFSLPVWNVARPSSFLVDRCGFVRFLFVARLSIHAAPIDAILQASREASRSAGTPDERSIVP